ncbi:MAG: hypothetical protein QGF46_00420 [Planctomycetota bacterium]|jgi:hypothetical protein|nr:hypothetical protein [Planctomycetota bacterium]
MKLGLILPFLLGACQLPSAALPPVADYITVTITDGENVIHAPSILVKKNQSAEMVSDDIVVRVDKNHSVEVLTTDPNMGENLVVDVDVRTAGEVQFEKMKSLAGEWEAVEGDFGSPMITYEVSSGGHSVIERLFPGEDYEMVSMYHMQNGRLAMTHYCSIGNQPFLMAKPSVGNTIDFKFIKLGNMKDKNEHHIRTLQMVFHAEDEITANWSSYKNNAPVTEPGASFHVKRVKRY